MAKTKRFEDLKAWQLANDFKKGIYKISNNFPKKEDYCLSSQIRNAAVSITANIAEGYGRYHYQETMQFCRIARGSLNEVLDHLHTALNENYITKEDHKVLYEQGRTAERVLNGYIAYIQKLSQK